MNFQGNRALVWLEYCMACFFAEGELVPLRVWSESHRLDRDRCLSGHLVCPDCKQSVVQEARLLSQRPVGWSDFRSGLHSVADHLGIYAVWRLGELCHKRKIGQMEVTGYHGNPGVIDLWKADFTRKVTKDCGSDEEEE